MSYAQNAPAFVSRCCSNVRYGWSDHSFCPRLGAALEAAPSGKPPRNHWTAHQFGSSLECAATTRDRWSHSAAPRHRLQSAECGDIAPATPNVCSYGKLQRTIAHPTPEYPPLEPEPVFAPTVVDSGLFLSHELTVLRETPKMRLNPRKEVRS